MTDRSEPTSAADRLREWINGDRDFAHAEPNRWLEEALAEAGQPDSEALRLLYVPLRDAITEHIEREAERRGDYQGDPAGTPGGTGYSIPAAVATQIVDKYLLEFLTVLPPSDPPTLDALAALEHLVRVIDNHPEAYRLDTGELGAEYARAWVRAKAAIRHGSAQPEAQPAEDADAE